jgi:WD40 repeat protein
LFDLTNGEWLTTFEGHSRDVRSVMLLNETKIVTCSVDKSIKIWNIKNGECEKTLKGHSNWVNAIVILSNETIASCSDDETVCIWKFRTFFRSFRKTTLKGHTRSVDCIAKISIQSIDSKNLYLLSGSSDKTIKLWDIDTAKCLRTFEGHEAPVVCLDSLTNERVLSSSADKTIKIWNVNNAFCLLTLSGHTDLVYCVRALSDDRIISGSRDRTIKVWCLQTNSCIETIKSCRESEIQVLSNDNVAFCLDKKNIKICELSNLRSFSKIFQTKDLISLYYIF